MDANPERSFALYLLMAALLFEGVSAIAGGIGLVSGGLPLPLSWLAGSPFDSYRIPGLILLVVLGVVPMAVLYGLWRRRYWGWLGALFVGVALIIWIVVEVMIVGYIAQPPLQLIYGLLGGIVLFLALLPGVRRIYE